MLVYHRNQLKNAATQPAATMESSDASSVSPATARQDGSVRVLRSCAKRDGLHGGITPSPSSDPPGRHTSRLRSQEELAEICDMYSVPSGFTPVLAGDLSICAGPPPGCACVCADAFEAGMRLPLHPFFAAVLDHFGIAPNQLAPDGWRAMAGFLALSRLASAPPSLPVFRHFFALKPHTGRAYSFRGEEGAGGLFLPTRAKMWRQAFFFLKSSAPWPCPVQWRWKEPSCSATSKPALNEEEKHVATRLLRARGGSLIDLNTYLHEANQIAVGRQPESSLPQKYQATDASVDVRTTWAEKAAAIEQASEEMASVNVEHGNALPCAPLIGKKRKLACGDGDNGNGEISTSCSPNWLSPKSPATSNDGQQWCALPQHQDGDSGDWKAAKQLLQDFVPPLRERELEASRPRDIVASSYMSLLQTAKHVAFSLGDYALDLEDKLRKVKAELAEAKAEADALRLETTATDDEGKALRAELHKVMSEPAMAHATIETMMAERWRDAEVVGALQVHLAKVKSELVETKAAGARSMDALQGQLGETNAELATARSAIKTVEAERDQHSAEAYGLQVELGVAKAKLIETKAARTLAIAVAEARRVELAKANADIVRKKAAAATANTKQKHAVAEANSPRMELRKMKAERDHHAAETRTLQGKLSKTNSELAEMKAAAATVKHAAAGESALRLELSGVETELALTKATAVTEQMRATAEADALQVELGRMNAELAKASSAMSTMKAERDRDSAENYALQVELGIVKAELTEAKAAGKHAVAVADALRVELHKTKPHHS